MMVFLMRLTVPFAVSEQLLLSANPDQSRTEKSARRFVQEAPDDINWPIDQAEFDDLLALKKGSAPGPDGIPYGAYRCAGGLGSQFFF